MFQYELTLLLKNEEDLKTIQELITSVKGKIQKEEKWGKKMLAYSIKKNNSAIFYLLHLDLADQSVNDMRQKLNFDDKIIRFLLLKVS